MKIRESPRVWMSVALAMGLFASGYLLFEYVGGGPIACGSAAGCETVRASAWAYVGPVPRPLLGVAFYVGMLFLLVFRAGTAWRAEWLRRLTFFGALVGVIESAHLFLVQWLAIGAFCLWCLVSGAATLVVFLLSFFDHPTASDERRLKDLAGYACVLAALVVLGTPAFLALAR